jgi:hypothetical protein
MNESVFMFFDEEYEVLGDPQGPLMLSKSEIDWLEEKLAKHKAHSALELETISRRMVEKHCPSMIDQINFDYFKD